MAYVVEFFGGVLGYSVILSIVYAGVGSTDRPFRRCLTLNALLIAFTVLLAGFGSGDNGMWNFSDWPMRVGAGLLITAADMLRLRNLSAKANAARIDRT
jgi:hypothetical protein